MNGLIWFIKPLKEIVREKAKERQKTMRNLKDFSILMALLVPNKNPVSIRESKSGENRMIPITTGIYDFIQAYRNQVSL